MAKFEGVRWAPRQMRYLLPEKQFDILEADAKVYGVSRSVFYASFLCFEGIRFFCKKDAKGQIVATHMASDADQVAASVQQ